jgi:integrase
MRKTKMVRKIDDPIANEWLDAQKPGTKTNYKGIWAKFSAFVKMSGSEILASRKEDKDALWEKQVLAFKTHLKDKGFADYTATTAAMAIRGFFSYYRMPLQFRKGETKRLREQTRKTEDYRFSLNDLQKMCDVANLQEKYVLLVGKSFGLRAGDFLRVTRGDLEPHIDSEPPISIGELRTEKESVSAFPFIDNDAKPVVKLMLEKMSREGRTGNGERILSYRQDIQLSRVLKRLVEKAGINVGGKQVRFHCMCKFLIDRLSSFMSDSKWKQVVGKQVSESAYVSPDSLRGDYSRAMSETCFTTQVGSQDMQKIARKEALLMLAKSMGMDETQVAGLFSARARFSRIGAKRTTSIDDEIATLEQAIEEKGKPKETENCENGHCQRVVGEEELAGLLAQGWHAELVLPSGKVVVTR